MAMLSGLDAPWRRTMSATLGTPAVSSTIDPPRCFAAVYFGGRKMETQALVSLPGAGGSARPIAPSRGGGQFTRFALSRLTSRVGRPGVFALPPHEGRPALLAKRGDRFLVVRAQVRHHLIGDAGI